MTPEEVVNEAIRWCKLEKPGLHSRDACIEGAGVERCIQALYRFRDHLRHADAAHSTTSKEQP